MADIAFLLLIFFLVTTTIDEDSGILVKLPAYEPNPPITPTSQVLTVIVNADNELMVEDVASTPRELPDLLAEFVNSPDRTPREAVVSLIHDRSTDYRLYVEVYDALLAGYRNLWDAEARRQYGRDFEMLNDEKKRKIRKKFPMVISEAEPSNVRG